MKTTTAPVKMLRRAEFSYDSIPMVSILITSGDVEIYAVTMGGLELFCGYSTDSAIAADMAVAAHNALARA